MYGDHRRRSQRSLRRPARLLRLQAPPGKRYFRPNLPENGHRSQTIRKKDWSAGPNVQASRHAFTGNPPKTEQDRTPAILPSRRTLPPHENRPAQPTSRHRAPHATSPGHRSKRPRLLLLALTRQAEGLQEEQGCAHPIRSGRAGRQGGADGRGGGGRLRAVVARDGEVAGWGGEREWE